MKRIILLSLGLLFLQGCSSEPDATYKGGMIPSEEVPSKIFEHTLRYGSAVSISKEDLKKWMTQMNEFYADFEELEDAEDLSNDERLDQAIDIFNTMLANDGYADNMYKLIAQIMEGMEGAELEHLKESAQMFKRQEVDKDFLMKYYQAEMELEIADSSSAKAFRKNPEQALAKEVIRNIKGTATHYALGVLEEKAEYVSEIGSSGSFKFQEGFVGILVMCDRQTEPRTALLFDSMSIETQSEIDVKKGRKEDMADFRRGDGYDWVL